MLEALTDTITALATPRGKSAIALIRMSGRLSAAILSRIASVNGKPFREFHSHRTYRADITDGNTLIDEAVVVFMKSPESFTGEDSAEIMTHGSPVIIERVLSLIIRSGARIAKNGEFTYRAFINGKLDLTEAEAVGDLIDSTNAYAASQSAAKLKGRLSSEVKSARDTLTDALVFIEANIDFPDDDTGTFSYDDLAAKLADAERSLTELLARSEIPARYLSGIPVVIAGRVNAGKSSIFNALAGSEHAIVTDIEGTTRDVLTATIYIDGIAYVLHDTAGLRAAQDPVEAIGVGRARAELANASVVIYVIDAHEGMTDADRHEMDALAGKFVICALNKSDLPSAGGLDVIAAHRIAVSTKNATGIDELRSALHAYIPLNDHDIMMNAVYVNERERSALGRGIHAINEARAAVLEKRPLDMTAHHVTRGAKALAEVLGEIRSADVINEIFSRFCIGK